MLCRLTHEGFLIHDGFLTVGAINARKHRLTVCFGRDKIRMNGDLCGPLWLADRPQVFIYAICSLSYWQQMVVTGNPGLQQPDVSRSAGRQQTEYRISVLV